MIFDSGLPVFGICYGQQTMCAQLGGKVESGHHREFGRAFLEVEKDCALFDGVWSLGSRHQVWMCAWRPRHGDPGRLRGRRDLRQRPLRLHRRREAQVLRRAVPPGSGAHARRRQADRQLRAQDRRHQGRLVDVGLSRQGRGRDPQTGRRQEGDLRAFRRRRQLGRSAPDPRGSRRPADLHPRRPWPDAQGRGGERRRHVRGAL